jgi:protein CWC15
MPFYAFLQGAQLPDYQSKQELIVLEAAASEEKRRLEKRSVLENEGEGGKLLSTAQPLLLTNDEVDTERVSRKYDDRDDDDDDDSDLDSSDSDSDDEGFEEELLQRELEKIKKEREEARVRKEAAESEESLRAKSVAANASNPLLGSQAVKRKWNDDVVFKNQARSEPEVRKRFVNDTIRNDFHRRFLVKYMR